MIRTRIRMEMGDRICGRQSGRQCGAACRREKCAGSRIAGQKISGGGQARAVAIFYLSANRRRSACRPSLARLRGSSVLTVADMDNFIESGGMIQFVVEDSRVRVAIDVGATGRARLKVSSKLLSLAHAVTGNGAGRRRTEMQWTRKLSLRRKITCVIMINTFAALCAAGIAFAEYGVYRFKELRLEDLNALANILGTNSTAPLAFKDPNSARDISAGAGRKTAHPVRRHLRPRRQALRRLSPGASARPLMSRRPSKTKPAGLPPTAC